MYYFRLPYTFLKTSFLSGELNLRLFCTRLSHHRRMYSGLYCKSDDVYEYSEANNSKKVRKKCFVGTHSEKLNMFKSSTTHWHVTRRVNNITRKESFVCNCSLKNSWHALTRSALWIGEFMGLRIWHMWGSTNFGSSMRSVSYLSSH